MAITGSGGGKIEEVRARADIAEVIGAHVRLKRAGRNLVGLCPFHNEKTPSFSVNPERGFFHCFGCGAGGTVFDFVMRVEALTFAEALQTLARRYGVALPERGAGGPSANERDSFARANQFAAEFYAHVLWNTQDGVLAREYLKSRGVTVETARAFMIGFAPARPGNLAANIAKRGLLEAAIKLGLAKRDNGGAPYDMFRARLMFPMRDPQGRVIAFGGRVLDNRLPKYINSAESPLYSKARALYGIYESRQEIAKLDRAIVVEGYIDAIALWQAGFKHTVASLGTSLTVDQLRLLSRYTRNVIACFDGDAAGRKASLRALEIFLQAGLLGRGVFIPQGHDPDTLVRDRGAAVLAEMVDSAELLMDYFLREQAQSARESIAARARAAERVAAILKMVANPFEFDLLARKAAGLLGIGEDVLRREARRGGATRRGPVKAEQGPMVQSLNASAQAELGLAGLALRYPELRAEIFAEARAAEFSDSAMAAIVEEICASDESQGSLEVSVMARIGESRRAYLTELMVGPALEDAGGARALMGDYFAALAHGRRRREVEELRRAAAAANGDEATAKAQAVIALRRQSGATG
jgi:DNA primase